VLNPLPVRQPAIVLRRRNAPAPLPSELEAGYTRRIPTARAFVAAPDRTAAGQWPEADTGYRILAHTPATAEVFLQDIRDLHVAEEKILGVLLRVVEFLRNGELRYRLSCHLCSGTPRIRRLEQILEAMGGKPGGIGSEPLQDLLRYAERHLASDISEHVHWKTARVISEYKIAAYLQANVHALDLDYEGAAEALQETLREEGSLHRELDLLADRIV
jgi:ferritin-like metal-binding protein YciE